MKAILCQRFGTPEEMAEAALFLLGNESAYITGQDIRINGGSQVS